MWTRYNFERSFIRIQATRTEIREDQRSCELLKLPRTDEWQSVGGAGGCNSIRWKTAEVKATPKHNYSHILIDSNKVEAKGVRTFFRTARIAENTFAGEFASTEGIMHHKYIWAPQIVVDGARFKLEKSETSQSRLVLYNPARRQLLSLSIDWFSEPELRNYARTGAPASWLENSSFELN